MRQIKKYSNRRLYDTQTSSYINLEELVDLICRGEKLVVTDARTDDDISSIVFLQALLELPEAVGLFPSTFIQRVIRYTRSTDNKPALAKQLAANLALLDAQFEDFEESFPWPEKLPLPGVAEPSRELEVDPEMAELALEMAALESRLKEL